MKKCLLILSLMAALTSLTQAAWALPYADFSYTGSKSGNHYTFTFDVKNSFNSPLDYFLITFNADPNAGNYQNVAWVNHRGWAPNAFQFDDSYGGNPAAITADASILGSNTDSIAKGATATGFALEFDYTGLLGMSQQLFSYTADFGTRLTDADPGYTVDYEETGAFRYVAPDTASVPEPSTIALLGAGLAGIAFYSRRRRQ